MKCKHCGHTGDVEITYPSADESKRVIACTDRIACWFRWDLSHYGREVAFRMSAGKQLVREGRIEINNGMISILQKENANVS